MQEQQFDRDTLEKFVIWWTTEEDCQAIGEPHSYLEDVKYWQSRDIEIGRNDKGILWVDDLPNIVAKQYRSRFGRAGRGRLWVDPFFQNLSGLDISTKFETLSPYFKERLERSGGIIIYRANLPFIRPLGKGVITDLNLTILENWSTNEPVHNYDFVRQLHLHYSSVKPDRCYMQVVVYTLTMDGQETRNQLKVVATDDKEHTNVLCFDGNFDEEVQDTLSAMIKKARVWLRFPSEYWQQLAKEQNVEIIKK